MGNNSQAIQSLVSKAIKELEIESDTDFNYLITYQLKHTTSTVHAATCGKMLKDYITEEDLSSCAFSTLAKGIDYDTYDEAKTLKIIKSTIMSLFATAIALDKFIDNEQSQNHSHTLFNGEEVIALKLIINNFNLLSVGNKLNSQMPPFILWYGDQKEIKSCQTKAKYVPKPSPICYGIAIPNYIGSASLFDFKVSMKSFTASGAYQNQYNEILDKVVPFKDFASVITKSIEGLE